MKKRRTFSAEYRRDAVRLVLEQGYSQAEAARSLGVGCTAISRWVQEFNARGDDAFPGHGNLPPSAAELKRLERENKQLRLEREILKKGGDLLHQRARLRHIFIASVKKDYPIALLCRAMNVSRSGFYRYQRTHEHR